MDTSEKIKDELILKIKNTTDMDLLLALRSLLNLKDDEFYELNPSQEESIAESRAQYNRGEFIENKKAISELKKWLKER